MKNNNTKKNVLIEMSGGVDSAVCAYLLKQNGYNCKGVMMRLHNMPNLNDEIKGARQICKHLNIPFELIDLRDKFYSDVIQYFINTYYDAKTPNPCIVCNKKMKFGIMFELAKKMNCEYLATGHYAQIIENTNGYELHKAKDINKDQSYVLHFLNQEQLSKIILPLGKLTKDKVRHIAKESHLPCANKPESQDICFIEDNDYTNFIYENTSTIPKEGDIVTTNCKKVGTHNGLINYTIGQRKGLGIAFGQPMYVVRLDSQKNQVVLGTKEEVMSNTVNVVNVSWINKKPPSAEFICQVKLRYRQTQKPAKCTITGPSTALILLDKPVSAITPGQFCVIYDKNKVLGGGEIV